MMKSNATNAKPLTIGEVARRAGIGVEAVRFYEREGLIEAPPRNGSGYRQYPPEVVARIEFTRRAKELGFSLKEIKELLELRLSRGATCEEIKRRAEARIAAMEEKIRALQRMKRALVNLTTACADEGPTSECPILDALEHGGKVQP